jgi:phosphate-selective porin OprO/OprP
VRIGADAAFTQGRLTLRGEVLRAQDERRGQGVGDVDLPDLVGQGWQVSATAFVVGGLTSSGAAPRQPLGRGGIGAVQVAARVEALGFRSDAPSEPAFRNPRAANVLPNDVRGVTLGVNWFPFRYVKVQWNVVREHLQDPERRPDPARAWITSRVFRVLFAI